jgi:hypothetical protein
MQWSVGEDIYNCVFIFFNLVYTNDDVWLHSKHSKTFQGIVGFFFNMWSAYALQAQGLKVVCVLCFCAEGDNVPDAFLIADGLHRFLNAGRKDLLGTLENTIITRHNYFLSIAFSKHFIIWSLTQTRANVFFWNGQEQELLGKFQYHGQLCMGLHLMIQCSADAVTVSISLPPRSFAAPFEVKSLWNCCSNLYIVLVLVGIVLVVAY